MTDEIQGILEQAYQSIQHERFDEARALLQPILHDTSDPDAWWLWANAVTEPAEARRALEVVLELEPGHDQARNFLARLDALYPVAPESVQSQALAEPLYQLPEEHEVAPVSEAFASETIDDALETTAFDEDQLPEIRELDFTGPAPREEDEEDFIDWPVEEPAPELEPSVPIPSVAPPAQKRTPWLRNLLVSLALVALAIVVALAVLNSRQDLPAASTATPQLAVLEPSETMRTVLEAASTGVTAAAGMLGGEPEAQLVLYEEAQTLVIRVCRGAGPDLAGALNQAMELAARYGISAQDELGYVGASLVNCARDDMLIEAFASIENAVAFAGGMQNLSEFQTGWNVVH